MCSSLTRSRATNPHASRRGPRAERAGGLSVPIQMCDTFLRMEAQREKSAGVSGRRSARSGSGLNRRGSECHQKCLARSAGVTSERVSRRAAVRVWRGDADRQGEVGSIVSAVDDIIPHQWRRARDERSRGEHAARAGWWWWGIKWANGGIINTMKIRKIDQTLRNLS